VVVDTEEEFDWSAPFDHHADAVTNIAMQPLAQEIMDRHGVVPTYVVDYPVANSMIAAQILAPIADRGGCEIGAHLHPLVNPPHENVVDEFHSFPGNLPPELEFEKLALLQDRIVSELGAKPTIYKAGRYGIGPSTFATLVRLGFRIDVSVVPHTDFSSVHGPDFTSFPTGPFRPSPELLALPLSVHFVGALSQAGRTIHPIVTSKLGRHARVGTVLSRLGILERLRLSPEGHSLADMKRQTLVALARGERYFMMTYHSSSLLPGANPYVRSEHDRQKFLGTIDGYFAFFRRDCEGRTRSVSAFAESASFDADAPSSVRNSPNGSTITR
jgi:hypothetical protein